MSFPLGTEMFQFARFASSRLCIHRTISFVARFLMSAQTPRATPARRLAPRQRLILAGAASLQPLGPAAPGQSARASQIVSLKI
jgi:hypothetical protein